MAQSKTEQVQPQQEKIINTFQDLYDVDVSRKVQEKNGLSYLAWAYAWAELKKKYPQSTCKVYESKTNITTVQTFDDGKGKTTQTTISRCINKPWFDDDRTGWVKCSVTVNGIEAVENLAVMDNRNKSIPADKIESTNAIKSIQRCLTKCCAKQGVGLQLWENGEIRPEVIVELEKLQSDCLALIKKKAELSEKAKKEVAELCKSMLPEENGDPKLSGDTEKLEELKKKLLAIRK